MRRENEMADGGCEIMRGGESERREVACRPLKEGTVECCGGSYGHLGLCYSRNQWISSYLKRFFYSSINIFIEILHIDKRRALYCIEGLMLACTSLIET